MLTFNIEILILNAVTAPLKIHYNESLGCFESNAPILARLLTDVEAAAVDDFSLSESDLEGKYSDADFYATDGEFYNSSFTTGLAVPFSVKSGNPNAFGPNLIQVEGSQDDASSDTTVLILLLLVAMMIREKSRSYQSG